MKHTHEGFACLGLLLLVGGCATAPVQGERNVTADGGHVASSCDAAAELSMLSAAMVITENSAVRCDRTAATLRTAVVAHDSYHALAATCRDKLFAELYYSTSRSALDGLPGLASTAAGANFALPAGVGVLVEARSVPAAQRFADASVYIQPGVAYSPNRLEYGVTFPGFIADFSRPGAITAPRALSAGQVVYYKWAKRVAKEGQGDPMRFSADTYSFQYQPPNSVDAGRNQTITAPEQNSVTLIATVVDAYGTMRPETFTWRVMPQNFIRDATLVNPSSPTTDVVFDDHGNHVFEFRASDSCGRTFRDEVGVSVNGRYDESSGRQVFVQGGATCERTGREMAARNTASVRMGVTIRETRDFRSWFDENTPGARQVTTTEYSGLIPAGEAIPLGCSVRRGTDRNGSDIGYVSYAIVSEQPQ